VAALRDAVAIPDLSMERWSFPGLKAIDVLADESIQLHKTSKNKDETLFKAAIDTTQLFHGDAPNQYLLSTVNHNRKRLRSQTSAVLLTHKPPGNAI
jgi:hypothetical protein